MRVSHEGAHREYGGASLAFIVDLCEHTRVCILRV